MPAATRGYQAGSDGDSAEGLWQPPTPASALPCRTRELRELLQPPRLQQGLDPCFTRLGSWGFAGICSNFYLGLSVRAIK